MNNKLAEEVNIKYYKGEMSCPYETPAERMFWMCERDAVLEFSIPWCINHGMESLLNDDDLPDILYNQNYNLMDRLMATYCYVYHCQLQFDFVEEDLRKYLEK